MIGDVFSFKPLVRLILIFGKSFHFLVLVLLSTVLWSQKNIIKINHSFTEGLTEWEQGSWGDAVSEPQAKGTIDHEEGHDDKACYKLVVGQSTKDNPLKVYLRRQPLKIKEGKTYTLSFWTKSKVADDHIKLAVFSSPETGSSKPWGGIVDVDLKFLGDGRWHQVSQTFVAVAKFPGAPVDYNKIGITLGFGHRKGDFYVDNMKLVRQD